MIKILPYLTVRVRQATVDTNCTRDKTKIHVPGVGTTREMEYSLVSEKAGCPFKALGAIDLLALHIRGQDPSLSGLEAYTRAVTWGQNNYGSLLNDSTAPYQIAEQLLYHRKLFDLMMKSISISPSSKGTSGISNLKKMGIDQNNDPFALIYLSAEHAKLLKQCLHKLNIDNSIPEIPLYVTPYYSQPHILSAIEVRAAGSKSNKTYTYIVTPYHTAYSGLPYMSYRPLLLFTDIPTLVQVHDPAMLKTIPKIGVDTETPTFSPGEDPLMILSKDNEVDTANICNKLKTAQTPVRCVYPEEYAQFRQASKGCDVNSYILDMVFNKIVHAKEITKEVHNLLEAVGPPPELKNALVSRLYSVPAFSNDLSLIQDLNRRFSDGVVARSDSKDIISDPGGYVYHDKRTGEKELITNFTLSFTSQVVFPEKASRYISGKVHVGSKTFPVVFDESALDNGKKLAATVQSWGVEEMEAPRVIEPDKMKTLLSSLRLKATKLKLTRGIAYLGWSSFSKDFYHPDFQAHEGDLTELNAPFLPDTNCFDSFSANLIAPKFHKDLPVEVCKMISILVGMLIRHPNGYTCQPVEVINNSNARRFISHLMRGLGQENPVHMNTNRANSVRYLTGLPFYSVGSASKIKTNTSCILLSDKGLSLPEVSDEDMNKAAETLAYIIRHVVPAVTDGQTWLKNPISRILYSDALQTEGAQIIMKALHLMQWPQAETDYPLLEDALSKITEESQAILFDLHSQKITLLTQHIPGKVSAVELAKELASLIKDIKIDGSRLIMPVIEGQRLLDQFFNDKAPYTIVSPPEEDQLTSSV